MDKPACRCFSRCRCKDNLHCHIAEANRDHEFQEVHKVYPYFLNSKCKLGNDCWCDSVNMMRSLDLSQEETNPDRQHFDDLQRETESPWRELDCRPRLLTGHHPEKGIISLCNEIIPPSQDPIFRLLKTLGNHKQSSKELCKDCGSHDNCNASSLRRSEENFLKNDNLETFSQKRRKFCSIKKRFLVNRDESEGTSDFLEASDSMCTEMVNTLKPPISLDSIYKQNSDSSCAAEVEPTPADFRNNLRRYEKNFQENDDFETSSEKRGESCSVKKKCLVNTDNAEGTSDFEEASENMCNETFNVLKPDTIYEETSDNSSCAEEVEPSPTNCNNLRRHEENFQENDNFETPSQKRREFCSAKKRVLMNSNDSEVASKNMCNKMLNTLKPPMSPDSIYGKTSDNSSCAKEDEPVLADCKITELPSTNTNISETTHERTTGDSYHVIEAKRAPTNCTFTPVLPSISSKFPSMSTFTEVSRSFKPARYSETTYEQNFSDSFCATDVQHTPADSPIIPIRQSSSSKFYNLPTFAEVLHSVKPRKLIETNYEQSSGSSYYVIKAKPILTNCTMVPVLPSNISEFENVSTFIHPPKLARYSEATHDRHSNHSSYEIEVENALDDCTMTLPVLPSLSCKFDNMPTFYEKFQPPRPPKSSKIPFTRTSDDLPYATEAKCASASSPITVLPPTSKFDNISTLTEILHSPKSRRYPETTDEETSGDLCHAIEVECAPEDYISAEFSSKCRKCDNTSTFVEVADFRKPPKSSETTYERMLSSSSNVLLNISACTDSRKPSKSSESTQQTSHDSSYEPEAERMPADCTMIPALPTTTSKSDNISTFIHILPSMKPLRTSDAVSMLTSGYLTHPIEGKSAIADRTMSPVLPSIRNKFDNMSTVTEVLHLQNPLKSSDIIYKRISSDSSYATADIRAPSVNTTSTLTSTTNKFNNRHSAYSAKFSDTSSYKNEYISMHSDAIDEPNMIMSKRKLRVHDNVPEISTHSAKEMSRNPTDTVKIQQPALDSEIFVSENSTHLDDDSSRYSSNGKCVCHNCTVTTTTNQDDLVIERISETLTPRNYLEPYANCQQFSMNSIENDDGVLLNTKKVRQLLPESRYLPEFFKHAGNKVHGSAEHRMTVNNTIPYDCTNYSSVNETLPSVGTKYSSPLVKRPPYVPFGTRDKRIASSYPGFRLMPNKCQGGVFYRTPSCSKVDTERSSSGGSSKTFARFPQCSREDYISHSKARYYHYILPTSQNKCKRMHLTIPKSYCVFPPSPERKERIYSTFRNNSNALSTSSGQMHSVTFTPNVSPKVNQKLDIIGAFPKALCSRNKHLRSDNTNTTLGKDNITVSSKSTNKDPHIISLNDPPLPNFTASNSMNKKSEITSAIRPENVRPGHISLSSLFSFNETEPLIENRIPYSNVGTSSIDTGQEIDDVISILQRTVPTERNVADEELGHLHHYTNVETSGAIQTACDSGATSVTINDANDYTVNNMKKPNAINHEVCDKCYTEYLNQNNINGQAKNQKEYCKKSKVCGICWEDVLSKSNKADRWFGILCNCKHSYCLKCIRQWQNAHIYTINVFGGNKTSCPECRVISNFIIPSEIWIEENEEKMELIKNYFMFRMNTECPHTIPHRLG